MAPKTRAKPSSKASAAPPKASDAPPRAPGGPPKGSSVRLKASSGRPKGRSGNGRAAEAKLDELRASGNAQDELGAAAFHSPTAAGPKKLISKDYDRELARLYVELVKLQEWIRATGRKVVILFEGRDAAGKGGVIKRITEPLNPRYCRVAALPAPTDREKTQWYFQRYVAHLPSAGEIVLFDRSWYNRAGVERVMGFCTEDEYREFLRSVPEFERMLMRSGIDLVKYWFSVSDAEQERRFQERIADPTKRWKLSPMDVESRARWVEYSKAKDEMFAHTDTKQSPWWVVPSDDKKRARLNTIAHLLSLFPYEDLTPEPISLPPRHDEGAYVRPPMSDQTFVPQVY